MPRRSKTLKCVALGLLFPPLALANPHESTAPDPLPVATTTLSPGHYPGARPLLELPPLLPRSLPPLLVAQAGVPGPIFDAAQISPLGDPAWVAAMRGPDPSAPVININVELRSSQKNELPATGLRGGDATVRNGQVLRNGRVFLIGAQRSALSSGGSILLAPGRAAELGDLGVPFVRVHVAAPAGTTLDIDGLVGRRPVIGIFNALFVPAPARRGETGATAVASVSVPAAGTVAANVVVKPAPLPFKPELVSVAYIAPVEDRSVALLPIPQASVEERIVTAYAAPVEDRSGIFASIPPAAVEERSFSAFVASVEDRSAMLAAIPPATVEERSFTAYIAAVEDRSAVLTAIPPATVEERSFMAFAAPVEDRAFAQRPLLPAPIEERAPVMIARDIGKRLPGPVIETTLAAAKEISATAATGLVKVALPAPVVVVAADSNAARRAETGDAAPAPVKLAAIQKRLPTVMIDRRGGYFFM